MKKISVCSVVALCAVAGNAFGVTNPAITKLINEKQQKMEQLEQCAKKVTGFKIAGISTLGLTAVGIGGNVALASKQKGLDTQISKVQTDLDAQKTELANINSQIATKEAAARQAEIAAKKEECAKQNGNWIEATAKCSFVAPTTNTAENAVVKVDEETVKIINGSSVKPNIGAACSEKDINDKLIASAVFAVAGGNTGIAGDTICNQNGQDVPCICSATKCASGANELLLAGGIKTCVAGAGNENGGGNGNGNGNGDGNGDFAALIASGRVIGSACSRADINTTNGFFAASDGADGAKTTKAKYRAVGSDWGMTCYSEEEKGELYCLCEATECSGNANLTQDGGLALCSTTAGGGSGRQSSGADIEKNTTPKQTNGRVIGAACSRADIEATNGFFAADGASAAKTVSAKYMGSANYGIVCQESANSSEESYCLCGATACSADADLVKDGLPICVAKSPALVAQNSTPTQGSNNRFNWKVLERADQAYGISESQFCQNTCAFGCDVNARHSDPELVDAMIKQVAGYGYWCKKKGGNWIEKDRSLHQWQCNSLPETACAK